MELLKDQGIWLIFLYTIVLFAYPKIIRKDINSYSSEELSTYSFKHFLKENILGKVLPIPNWSLVVGYAAIKLLVQFVSGNTQTFSASIFSITSTIVTGILMVYVFYTLKKREISKVYKIETPVTSANQRFYGALSGIGMLFVGIFAYSMWSVYFQNGHFAKAAIYSTGIFLILLAVYLKTLNTPRTK